LNSKKAAERAEALLAEMESPEKESDMIPAPNQITYNTVIKAMRNGSRHKAERAEELLSLMEQRSQTDKEFRPDCYTYTAVISAYGRSNAPNKAQKACDLLQRMIAAYMNGNFSAKPNIHSFNAALNACAFTEGDRESKLAAFSILVSITIHDIAGRNQLFGATAATTANNSVRTGLEPKWLVSVVARFADLFDCSAACLFGSYTMLKLI